MQRRDDRPAGERCDITLRDTFAAAALTGLLSNVPRYQLGPLTEQAFEIADEMIKKSSKTAEDREMLSEFQKFVQEEKKKMDDDPLDYKRTVLTEKERDALQVAIRCVNEIRRWKHPEDGTREGLVANVATLRDLLVRLA
jgi:hypothetical protein